MSEPSLNEVRDEYMFATQEVDMDGYVIVSSQEAYAQFDAALAAHDREVKAEVRESLAADLDHMSAEPHQSAEYRAGLGHAADLVRPFRRIESEARPWAPTTYAPEVLSTGSSSLYSAAFLAMQTSLRSGSGRPAHGTPWIRRHTW